MADQAPSEKQDQLRIDLQDEGSMHEWAKKLDATPEQLKEAVGAVGDLASDVEAHLKGSRSSVNSDRSCASRSKCDRRAATSPT